MAVVLLFVNLAAAGAAFCLKETTGLSLDSTAGRGKERGVASLPLDVDDQIFLLTAADFEDDDENL